MGRKQQKKQNLERFLALKIKKKKKRFPNEKQAVND
jgi:hypothetical protein